ncbi:magnesium transporter MgtE N-terminal domain-containing protein [Dictyobacter kobayashii]|uniref:Membrane protein n=1 Tax=Dictyobacter kobayashii TaxID=2014872 RepID=A0A402AFP8_9CHLR|nr:CBS domain-containing protein [Dictyobacter kobayashii]GCE17931.1 membrane protein [Dictyobacter kobayashii]
MLYLSQLLGAPVLDQHNVRVGKIIDLLAQASQVGQGTPTSPTALLVEVEDDQQKRVPMTDIIRSEGTWHLRYPIERFAFVQSNLLNEDEFRLAQEILDKQIIDLEHKKMVRVNDLCFSDAWQILGVDKSSLGLVRRLAPSWLANAINQPTSSTLVPWEKVELMQAAPYEEENKDKVPTSPLATPPTSRTLSGHLSELHPADIASIVHQVTVEQGARLIERLDNEMAADTMEEIDTERQAQILENLPDERATGILHAMGPDEVADLLGQLPEERQQELLRQLNPEDSEEVQDLLEYEANTAGGLMTTDYIVLNQTRTAQDALTAIRAEIIDNDVRIAYVYCVNDEDADEYYPLGVISIWDLLVAQPTQTLQDIMETNLIKVLPDADPRAVVETLAKYNLLALPVVNENGILEGVVTIDDALDTLLPEDRRRKPKRMY